MPTRMVTIVGVMAALVAVSGLLAPSAAVAGDKVPLGGGAGIALGGTLCTLATIGHDNTGELVGFTDAHCGGPGVPVAAEGGPAVGNVVAANDDLHYAVIKFDPSKVAPIPDFDGFTINGIGPTPGYRQLVCQQSRATGHSCAPFYPIPKRPGMAELIACRNPDDPGDDGAPVTANDLLIGMIRDVGPPPPEPCPSSSFGTRFLVPEFTWPPGVVLIDAIIDDLNAKGGPGAGFTPVPA
jgi:hypothetical protein